MKTTTVKIESDHNSVVRYFCDLSVIEQSLLRMESAFEYCEKRQRPSMSTSNTFIKWHTYQFDRNTSIFARWISDDIESQGSSAEELRKAYIGFQSRELAKLYPNPRIQEIINQEVFCI